MTKLKTHSKSFDLFQCEQTSQFPIFLFLTSSFILYISNCLCVLMCLYLFLSNFLCLNLSCLSLLIFISFACMSLTELISIKKNYSRKSEGRPPRSVIFDKSLYLKTFLIQNFLIKWHIFFTLMSAIKRYLIPSFHYWLHPFS